jgi:drug/metabolite transporter (DMT)-like permease
MDLLLTGLRVQMFIGESGSWLVILGFYIYRQFVLRTHEAPLLYQRVNTEDEEEDDETVRPSSRGGTADPALKPLVPNAEDRAPLEGWKVVLLGLPACCDITGTTLMNVGLLFVAASIYQMTRGALVLFVGLFSVLFLKRKLYLYHWMSLLIVVLGVALVGLAGAIYTGDKNSPAAHAGSLELIRYAALATRDAVAEAADPAVLRTILGIFLIAFAQIFTATQFCLEEWILENYALEPLKVVAWEGLFGLIVTVLLQIVLHFTIGISKSGKYGYFDAEEGYRQIFTNRAIGISSLAIMVSIGGFNFFGLSVTRSISATSRSIIDTCRTLFIWIVSLGLGWETFKWLQVVGFALVGLVAQVCRRFANHSPSSSMVLSCSMTLLDRLSKLFYHHGKRASVRASCPRSQLSICRAGRANSFPPRDTGHPLFHRRRVPIVVIPS